MLILGDERYDSKAILGLACQSEIADIRDRGRSKDAFHDSRRVAGEVGQIAAGASRPGTGPAQAAAPPALAASGSPDETRGVKTLPELVSRPRDESGPEPGVSGDFLLVGHEHDPGVQEMQRHPQPQPGRVDRQFAPVVVVTTVLPSAPNASDSAATSVIAVVVVRTGRAPGEGRCQMPPECNATSTAWYHTGSVHRPARYATAPTVPWDSR
jgi:hypothetical protein